LLEINSLGIFLWCTNRSNRKIHVSKFLNGEHNQRETFGVKLIAAHLNLAAFEKNNQEKNESAVNNLGI